MPTFSQVVDNVLKRGGRPARGLDAQAYVRASIRECQVLAVFVRDLIEDKFNTDGTDPYIWTRPTTLRILKTFKYVARDIYPDYLPPGKIQQGQLHYYYGGPTYYVLNGVGNTAVEIGVAYYTYAPRFVYYAETTPPIRPAFYDIDNSKWQYLQNGVYVDTLGSDTLNQAAQDLVTNWLLFDWTHLIEEGGLAKLYKNLGDGRSVSSFALFKSFQKDLLRGERTETLVD